MAKLVVFLADGKVQDVILGKERITLGRRADNDVCLPHPAVSGEHAAVVTILSDSFLEDLGSTNGTLVNGKPITKHFLRDGDVIDVGRQRLVYLVDDSAQPEAIAPAPAPDWPREAGLQNIAATTEPTTQWTPAGSGSNGAAVVRPSTLSIGDDAPLRAIRSGGIAAILEEQAVKPSGGVRTGSPHGFGTSDLMVLTGPNAGRTLTLTKEVTSVGRAGVQMALIRRTAEGFLMLPGDGSLPPLLNGAAVQAEGALLEPGDILEVAGARIEYGAVPDLPT
ncbi:MAG: FHA domain-containing protein [Betaproteobacteria bacterium]